MVLSRKQTLLIVGLVFTAITVILTSLVFINPDDKKQTAAMSNEPVTTKSTGKVSRSQESVDAVSNDMCEQCSEEPATEKLVNEVESPLVEEAVLSEEPVEEEFIEIDTDNSELISESVKSGHEQVTYITKTFSERLKKNDELKIFSVIVNPNELLQIKKKSRGKDHVYFDVTDEEEKNRQVWFGLEFGGRKGIKITDVLNDRGQGSSVKLHDKCFMLTSPNVNDFVVEQIKYFLKREVLKGNSLKKMIRKILQLYGADLQEDTLISFGYIEEGRQPVRRDIKYRESLPVIMDEGNSESVALFRPNNEELLMDFVDMVEERNLQEATLADIEVLLVDKGTDGAIISSPTKFAGSIEQDQQVNEASEVSGTFLTVSSANAVSEDDSSQSEIILSLTESGGSDESSQSSEITSSTESSGSNDSSQSEITSSAESSDSNDSSSDQSETALSSTESSESSTMEEHANISAFALICASGISQSEFIEVIDEQQQEEQSDEASDSQLYAEIDVNADVQNETADDSLQYVPAEAIYERQQVEQSAEASDSQQQEILAVNFDVQDEASEALVTDELQSVEQSVEASDSRQQELLIVNIDEQEEAAEVSHAQHTTAVELIHREQEGSVEFDHVIQGDAVESFDEQQGEFVEIAGLPLEESVEIVDVLPEVPQPEYIENADIQEESAETIHQLEEESAEVLLMELGETVEFNNLQQVDVAGNANVQEATGILFEFEEESFDFNRVEQGEAIEVINSRQAELSDSVDVQQEEAVQVNVVQEEESVEAVNMGQVAVIEVNHSQQDELLESANVQQSEVVELINVRQRNSAEMADAEILVASVLLALNAERSRIESADENLPFELPSIASDDSDGGEDDDEELEEFLAEEEDAAGESEEGGEEDEEDMYSETESEITIRSTHAQQQNQNAEIIQNSPPSQIEESKSESEMAEKESGHSWKKSLTAAGVVSGILMSAVLSYLYIF